MIAVYGTDGDVQIVANKSRCLLKRRDFGLVAEVEYWHSDFGFVQAFGFQLALPITDGDNESAWNAIIAALGGTHVNASSMLSYKVQEVGKRVGAWWTCSVYRTDRFIVSATSAPDASAVIKRLGLGDVNYEDWTRIPDGDVICIGDTTSQTWARPCSEWTLQGRALLHQAV